MENKILEAALDYSERLNFSVIPIKTGEKKAMVKWEPYQKNKATRDEITAWWTSNPRANIGIVTGEISNLFVVDCDSDEGNDNLNKLGFDSIVTPCVSTPSGGYHLYFKYPAGHNISIGAGKITGTDFRGNGGYVVAPPSINGNGKGYAWTTECSHDAMSFLPEAYIKLISTYKEHVVTTATSRLQGEQVTTSDYIMFRDGTRDQDLFHIAYQLTLARTPENEIRQVLEILARNCNPPFSLSEMEEKIKSALKRGERREGSLAQEIKEWVRLQVGTFCLQNVHNWLQLTTRPEKKNAAIILRRLAEGEDRLLDKVPGQAGVYKTVNRDLKKIDLSDRSDLVGELNIRFPFGLEELIKPMPGCVYVIAGETDSGKSAFLMNFAKKNVDNFAVHYFSTEMGKQEMLDRAEPFWPDMGSNKNFNFYERYDDFDQVIFPDDINVIDYLETFTDFYMMAGFIKNIGKKLNKGIALIALQKPKGRDEGEGGERTKNLPRLYLSMAPNVLKIVKAKNWRHSRINPNKMQIEFKLVDGCKFISDNRWVKKDA
jgi:hypothetical protein